MQFPNINLEEYFITIALTNTQDSSVHFRIMTCSWGESFITNNDSISVASQQCDSNFPETIEIKPHKSMKFFGKLRSTSKAKPPNFKLGFIDLPYKEFFASYSKEDKKKYRTFWSNIVILESQLNNYKPE
jgi:hypothetical protein